jgi:cyclopropane-fatty-acyl-phospholipid synthase
MVTRPAGAAADREAEQGPVRMLANLIAAVGARAPAPFRVILADGTTYDSGAGTPAVTLRFRSRRAEARTLVYGHLGILEAYFDGDLDIEGDFAAAWHIGLDSGFADARPPLPVRIRNAQHELLYSNASREQARANARFHYGHGTPFYRLWLDDPYMMYTCAYWSEGTQTLEQAQANKIDHVARKARLQEGDDVVDIGTGFGGFMFRAVERLDITGTALNTTPEQVDWLRGEVARRGLAERIQVREADFRDVDRQYDKVISIGVLEHAGRDQLREVVRAHADFLKPGGLGVLHFIGHVGVRDTEFYIRKYVFPGGWIPSLSETLAEMEACGLEILDVENLRRHYALTLDAWAERFDRRWSEIAALDPAKFNERFRRIWRTYLYSCAAMFRSPASQTCLFQITFSKGMASRDGYPMSRRFLYEAPH